MWPQDHDLRFTNVDPQPPLAAFTLERIQHALQCRAVLSQQHQVISVCQCGNVHLSFSVFLCVIPAVPGASASAIQCFKYPVEVQIEEQRRQYTALSQAERDPNPRSVQLAVEQHSTLDSVVHLLQYAEPLASNAHLIHAVPEPISP